MNSNFQRKFLREFLRAPLKSEVLYIDGENVFSAKTTNISEGGILLNSLPHVPEVNAIPLILVIPEYPKLSLMDTAQVRELKIGLLEHKVIKVKAKMVRNFDGKSAVEKILLKHIGCEFYPLSESNQKCVLDYVSTFAKNIVFLLSLFEANYQKKENLEFLKKVAEILGYDSKLSIPLLRQKVLHDYQSLESL